MIPIWIFLNIFLSIQAQMVRRVKAYLKSMKVITDEDELHKMSLECEPPQAGMHQHQTVLVTASSFVFNF